MTNGAIWKRNTSADTVAALNRSCLADFGARQASKRAWNLDDWLGVMEAGGLQVESPALLEERSAAKGQSSPPASRG